MGRSSIAVMLILMLGTLASASHAGPVTIGVRAGSSIPNLHAGNDNPISTGWSSRVAFAFGLFAEFQASPSFSIQPEVDFAPQGGKRDGSQPAPVDATVFGLSPGTLVYADYHSEADIDYLEIPVLAKVRFGGARRAYATLGPFVGFLLSARNVTSGQSDFYLDEQLTQPLTGSTYDLGATSDIQSDLKSYNWGVQGGFGYGLPVGSGHLDLDVRGGYGLMNVQKDTAVNGANNTGSLVIALAYGMPVR